MWVSVWRCHRWYLSLGYGTSTAPLANTIHGSPDTVLRKIEEFKAVGTTSLMLHYPPYYGQERTLEMLRLFSKEVLPHVHAMDVPRLIAAE